MRVASFLLAVLVALSARSAHAASSSSCYERVYDRAHLDKHPEQPVTAIKVWDLGQGRRALWFKHRDGAEHLPLVGRPSELGFSLKPKGADVLLKLGALSVYGNRGELKIPADTYRLSPCRPDEKLLEVWSLEEEQESGARRYPNQPWLAYAVNIPDTMKSVPGFDSDELPGWIILETEPGERVITMVNGGCRGPWLNVAVLDMSEGKPRVHTSRGPRDLGNLEVGVKDGLRVYDAKTFKEVARFRAPDIETGESKVVGVDDRGAVLFQHQSAKGCVALSRGGKLENRPAPDCARKPAHVPADVFKKVGLEPAHERGDGWNAVGTKGGRYLVFVRFIAAC